jgi:ABC-type multidrug transport system fused ATPase/permease subunit
MSTEPIVVNNEIPKTPLRFLWWSIKPYWFLGLIGILLGAANQVVATYASVFIGRFVDVVTVANNPEIFLKWGLSFVAILGILFLLIRIAAFIAIPFILRQNERSSIGARQHLLFHSNGYFESRFAGALTNKLFNVSDRGSELLMMMYHGLPRILVSIVAAGIFLAFINMQLASGYTVIILLAVFGNIFLVRYRRPFVVKYAAANSKFRGYVNDVVSNIQAVRQYARRNDEMVSLNNSLYERSRTDTVQWRLGEYNQVFNNVVVLILTVVLVWWCYQLLLRGEATVGEMVIVMLLMYRVSGIITDLADWMNRVIRVYGEVEEGFKEIFLPHDILDHPHATTLVVPHGKIEWQNVSFSHGEQPVFTNFNLTIPPGQRLGLVGPSGAGKSTFVSLMLRQHDLESGTITIDTEPIHEVTQDSLRANIAVVPQEPALFHRTIKENISYGKPDATDEEIEAVAKKAYAHDFIMELPEQYNTLVGERGVKLSGGQKQRIAIARAMLKDAPILILDEATSALDSESEAVIQKALHILMAGKTVIAIAHRLSTLREMDRIVVLDQGTIIEDGTHDALLDYQGTYAKLWQHQAGGFVGE